MKVKVGFQEPATDFHCDLYESSSHSFFYFYFSNKYV